MVSEKRVARMTGLRALWRRSAEGEAARYRYLIVASLCFFLVLIALAIFGQGGWLTVRRVGQDVTYLQQEISRLREDNERLRREIVELRTNPAVLEDIAREELGMVRPGEVVYEIVDRGEQREGERAE